MTEEPREPEAQAEPEPIEPPSPAQLEKAENLIRQAAVAKMRGDNAGADKLLQEAQEAAPTSPAVLEAIGDDYMARGQKSKAMEVYKQAFTIDPKAISAERKYAELVLHIKAISDPFMTMEMADAGTYASGKIAVILSLLVPGLGQYVLGYRVKGVAFFAVVLICWIILLAVPGMLSTFPGLFGGKVQFNPLVLVFLFPATVAHLWSVFDATAESKRMTPLKVEKPTPPDVGLY